MIRLLARRTRREFPLSTERQTHHRNSFVKNLGRVIRPYSAQQRSFTALDAHHQPNRTYVNIWESPIETLAEMFEKTCASHSGNLLFGMKKGSSFDWMTYAEFYEIVGKTRTIFRAHFQLRKDEKVALISNNRWEWAAITYATIGLGAQIVPMYEAQLEQDWQYILQDSGAKVLMVSSEKIYDTVKHYKDRKIGRIEQIVCLDAPADQPHSYQSLVCTYSPSLTPSYVSFSNGTVSWLQRAEKAPQTLPSADVSGSDICTIIYTSGTTGRSKGVELSHRNILSNIRATQQITTIEQAQKISLAFLPWAHVFGQVNELHTLISTGSSLAIVPHRDLIMECIQIVKPNVLYSVPVMLNRIYDGVMREIRKQSAFKQAVFSAALHIARRRNERLEFNHPVHPILEKAFQISDKIVFQKIRQRLGGNVKRIGAGGAAVPLEVLQFFEDVGLPIVEGYGLTETAPVVCAGALGWERRRLGCVGAPLPGVDVKIVEPSSLQILPHDTDGEIVVHGPNVMRGYHNNPQATDEAFLAIDGKKCFRTGDLGRLVGGKFLKITGRIKEQFKLENGKFVVPAPLEDIFARGPFIAQSVVYGANKSQTVLLVVPNYMEWYQWASSSSSGSGSAGDAKEKQEILALLPKDISTTPPAEIGKREEDLQLLQKFVEHAAFIREVTKEIIRHSQRTRSYERPAIWLPIPQPFTQEKQFLTPKLSYRRENILKAYQSLIDSMYEGLKGNRIDYPKSSDNDPN